MWPGVLLTGPPGIGKSTATKKIAEMCQQRGLRVEGFVTEELRERGVRVGFDLVGLGGAAGRRAPLARVASGRESGPKVGKYVVTLAEFEALALPILDDVVKIASAGPRCGAGPPSVVCIIDEIGKMELFSQDFVAKMRTLLRDAPAPSLITVALLGQGLISEAKRARGFQLFELNEANRNGVPDAAIARLLGEQAGAAAPPRSLQPSAEEERSPGRPAARWRARRPAEEPSPPGEGGSTVSSATPASAPTVAKGGRVVAWLRNELRVGDNPLLAKAAQLCQQHGASLVPLVCLDPKGFAAGARARVTQVERLGPTRRNFLEETLADLAATLESCGSQLFVCEAPPEVALPAAAGAGGLVLATAEFCTEERGDEARVRRALTSAGASLELLDPAGITTLFGSAELKASGVREGAGFPDDFQDFYRPVLSRLPAACRGGLVSLEALPAPPKLEGLPGLRGAAQKSTSASSSGPRGAGPAFKGGEKAALERLKSWLAAGGLGRYKATFRRMLGDYSSRLAPHLALGTVSVRRVAAEALDTAGGPTASPHIEHFLYELCWRDFFRHAARRWGSSLFRSGGPLGSAGANADWKRSPEAEERWRSGRTGVPLVDAVQRELAATGYIGNLARQITAAYLVEDLGLDWRIGAEHFEAMLMDYDVHSNWGQWARSAGVVPTNEGKRRRVGGTRYYDLALGLQAGEAARYIRTWVSELSALPDAEVFAPWLSQAQLAAYPKEPLCSPELQRYFENALSVVGSKGGGKKGGKGGGGYGGKGGKR